MSALPAQPADRPEKLPRLLRPYAGWRFGVARVVPSGKPGAIWGGYRGAGCIFGGKRDVRDPLRKRWAQPLGVGVYLGF